MLNEKFVTAEQAVSQIPDGAYVGIGGFWELARQRRSTSPLKIGFYARAIRVI